MGIIGYHLLFANDRIGWPIDRFWVQIHRALYPPEEILFFPEQQLEPIVQATLLALTPASRGVDNNMAMRSTPTLSLSPTTTPLPAATSLPTVTPFPTALPLPVAVQLEGVRNEVESRNNCGPATLAMALSYWGWQGDQQVIRAVLRPNLQVDDKNVMPAEMAAYVHSHTNLLALVRAGGDEDMLKSLVAGGFPVIVEKGHITTGWIGHYIFVTGYDDSQGHFLTQDSLIVTSDNPVTYEKLVKWWRHFNYLYLVIYPPERQSEVLTILGPHADVAGNFQAAAEKARQEIPVLEGRDLFFAWYNLGSSLVGLGDFSAAAQAYDTAYAEIYPAIKKDERPWRALWYQTGPYQAYYSTGRHQNVIDLADSTLRATGSPILEESLFWRGLSREALGDLQGARSDFKKAARLNPNSTPALEQFQRLGGELP